jgi:hypothetical protein
VWWCTCNPEFGRLREEDFKFEANLGYDPISKERERERERERRRKRRKSSKSDVLYNVQI